MEDVVIVGAGPCGISVAIECKRRGLKPLIIEKESIVNTIYRYPRFMNFFSSADKIEIGDLPFTTTNDRPTREEALVYYRRVLGHYDLQVRTYQKVEQIDQDGQGFVIQAMNLKQEHKQYHSKYVVVATGYYDNPLRVGILGEEQEHVHHYFSDAHPYYGQRVVVMGGRHSAIHAALQLQQVGAHVTMVYRRGSFDNSIKPWIRPIIEGAIRNHRIQMFWETQLTEIGKDFVIIENEKEQRQLPADTVFALTGYRPDFRFFRHLKAWIDPESEVPVYNQAMESTVSGLYLAGVIATGKDPTKIFIENGRFHGQKIADDIYRKESL